MRRLFLTNLLGFGLCHVALGFFPFDVSAAQKKAFLELLATLPHKGEFFTDEAVKKAGPYLPVLFSFTKKDLEGHDIYPFGALSRGLCERKRHRNYAVRHFAEIRHPMLKLLWGVMLFDANTASPEIMRFLRDAFNSEEQSRLLAEITGPQFGEFKEKVQTRSKPKARK